MGAGCIVHCNKVSKPVKGKYLLLCVNSIMYFLLTSYNLIMFLKVLSHFMMKIKNFMKYFKEGVLKYFKISMKFLNIWVLDCSWLHCTAKVRKIVGGAASIQTQLEELTTLRNLPQSAGATADSLPGPVLTIWAPTIELSRLLCTKTSSTVLTTNYRCSRRMITQDRCDNLHT